MQAKTRTTRPPYETQLPRLSVSELRRFGVLKAEADALEVFECGSLKFLARWLAEASLLIVTMLDDGKVVTQNIVVAWRRHGFGQRAFLVCAETRRERPELFYNGWEFVDRAAPSLLVRTLERSPSERRSFSLQQMRDRLLGLDGRAPARGDKRRRLIARMERDPHTFELWPELKEMFDKYREKVARRSGKPFRANQAREAGPTCGNPVRYTSPEDSMAWCRRQSWARPEMISLAAHGAKTMPGHPMGGGAIALGMAKPRLEVPEWLSDQRPPIASPIERGIKLITTAPFIDFKKIDDEALLVGDLRTAGWEWQLEAGRVLNVSVLYPDQIAGGTWFYLIRQYGPQSRPDSFILHTSILGNGRRTFVCPIRKTNAARLYFRSGQFASAVAQQLIHPSQRKSGSLIP